MIVQGQTIDQKYYRVFNLRTGKNGDVPCSNVTLGKFSLSPLHLINVPFVMKRIQ